MQQKFNKNINRKHVIGSLNGELHLLSSTTGGVFSVYVF